MLFGTKNFTRTSEFNRCGCLLIHSYVQKQYVIEDCHFSTVMRLYFYLQSYLITSLSVFLVKIPKTNRAAHCV